MFGRHILYKGFEFRIHKEFLEHNNGKTNNPAPQNTQTWVNI